MFKQCQCAHMTHHSTCLLSSRSLVDNDVLSGLASSGRSNLQRFHITYKILSKGPQLPFLSCPAPAFNYPALMVSLLHPQSPSEAIYAFYALLSQALTSLGFAFVWSLGFTTALIVPVPYVFISLIVAAWTIWLAYLHVLPTLIQHSSRLCSRFSAYVRPQHRKAVPIALIAGLAFGLSITLAIFVYNAKNVTRLLDFVYEGVREQDPLYRSYSCLERGMPADGRPQIIEGWSYLLKRFYTCERIDELVHAVWVSNPVLNQSTGV